MWVFHSLIAVSHSESQPNVMTAESLAESVSARQLVSQRNGDYLVGKVESGDKKEIVGPKSISRGAVPRDESGLGSKVLAGVLHQPESKSGENGMERENKVCLILVWLMVESIYGYHNGMGIG